MISIRSRHSRRALAIWRSASAFARGAWTGVFMIRTPIAVNTASNSAANFVSRSCCDGESRSEDAVLDCGADARRADRDVRCVVVQVAHRSGEDQFSAPVERLPLDAAQISEGVAVVAIRAEDPFTGARGGGGEQQGNYAGRPSQTHFAT